ncbi:hypothetical protein Afil01_47990 [Actinorhabdospora filicis]|uniref:histidine kinase n=1 Tax=Actinorhabdospora filicis TaxID=1785913 RepID=A0A9W6SPY7_9ACTN|nr:histidine kinase [Actinorhabdospora filicis]GLZ79992.1 hypothetical protein Afil01_47990 [Actinorhabdospora filicis]
MNLLRRPLVQDTGLALGLLITSAMVTGMGVFTEPPGGGGADLGVLWWLLSLAAGLAIALRRRWPIPLLMLSTAAVALHMAMGLGAVPIDLAVPILLATVAGRHGRKVSLAILAALIIAVGVWNVTLVVRDGGGDGGKSVGVPEAIGKVVAIQPAPPNPPFGPLPLPKPEIDDQFYISAKVGVLYGSWGGLPVTVPVLIAGWAFGSRARARRALMDELTAHTRHLERERDQRDALAVAGERARIGRELHDAVAHGLSVMVVQAQGGEAALDARPEDARRALQAIVDVGRRSLADMRRTLNAYTAPDLAPAPGVSNLAELAARVRDSGTPVRLVVKNDPVELPASVDLSAYRIVQEALTNVVKHAGPGASALVDVEYTGSAVLLTVTDDGAGSDGGDGRGNGVRGMRERAALLGGALEAGPGPDGGFRVTAMLPIREAE